ncbi:hypothetical protein QR680_003978 [Steinernema hermaphroditum]|uniref:CHK kinase-like domain-containing protein n=1 Tax=Steinernema hermaphroditum TaxID=289476 RepID=A0AA39LT85_9BILA|nr:hypothetical protein QR680_003978 [Steinernema hermaphroditum]
MATVADSSFTVEWLLNCLAEKDEEYKKFREQSEVEKVDAADISGGQGFGSNVYRCELTFKNGQIYTVILKVPRSDKVEEEAQHHDENDIAIAHNVHNRECYFYENFASSIQIPLAKVYATREWHGKEDGCLLMENLSGIAKTAKLQDGFGKEEILTIAGYLAKLQAFFLCHSNEEWKEKQKANMFNTVHASRFFVDILDAYEKNSHVEAVSFLRAVLNNQRALDYAMYDHAKETGLPVAFVHGDLWTHNIMWKVDGDGQMTKEVKAILDWQMIHSGSPTFDLARFLAISVDPEIRRKVEIDTLTHFYNTLVSELKNRGKAVDIKLEQIIEAYRVNFVHQSLHIVGLVDFFPDIKEVLEKRADAALEDVQKFKNELPAEVSKVLGAE